MHYESDGNMDTWCRATATNIWRYDWQSESLGYLKRMNETADNTRYGIYFMGCKEWRWNFRSAWGVFDGFWNNDSGLAWRPWTGAGACYLQANEGRAVSTQ